MTGIMAAWLAVASSPQGSTPVSKYAPAEDLVAQFELFLERVETDLSDKANYGKDQKGRVIKNGATLIVLAQALGTHDKENKLKAKAAALVAAAQKLAAGAGDYDKANAALDELKKALAAKGDGKPVKWTAVADLQTLMEQVPIVNNSLRRGVTSRRFKRSQDRTAGYAATLAALAEASRYDDTYCGDAEDVAAWQKICDDMRDASAETGAAVRRGDQQAATAALAKIVHTCDACHHKFRD